MERIRTFFRNLFKKKVLYKSGEFHSPPIPITAFPSDVIKFMKANATPRQSFKLMKTNKYFCPKTFPFHVVPLFYGEGPNSKLGNNFAEVSNIRFLRTEDLQNNLWLVDVFYASEETNIATVLSKSVYFDIKSLYFTDQSITLNELKILTVKGKVKSMEAYSTIFSDGNGKNAFLEDIFNCMKNVKYITFKGKCPSFGSIETAKNTYLRRLQILALRDIKEEFNLETFFAFVFLIKNRAIVFSIYIHKVNDQSYLHQLQFYYNKILESNYWIYGRPYMVFPGQIRTYLPFATTF